MAMIGLRRKCRVCLIRSNARLVATNAGGGDGGAGDSGSRGKGPKGKDFNIDFNALFKSVGNKPVEKKEGAPEPIDFKKLFNQSGETSSTEKGQIKLDLGGLKKEPTVDSEKLKIDLGKLFADSSGPKAGSGEGGLKGFKLDLSKLKGRGDQGALPKPAASTKTGTTDASRREISLQKLGVLNKFASAMGPGLTAAPPKDHLLEKYFAPENMASAERRKIELHRIRDEFKLHDSDCGSSAVQIAMISKKIRFLSEHLTAHRKDKHSRRGLMGMVQNRRKLLMYLRRKDWDMYCHVLARLGLKDKLDVAEAARKKALQKNEKDKKKKKKKRRARAKV